MVAALAAMTIVLYAQTVSAASSTVPTPPAIPTTNVVRVGLVGHGGAKRLTVTASAGPLAIASDGVPCQTAPATSVVVEATGQSISVKLASGTVIAQGALVKLGPKDPGALTAVQADKGRTQYYRGAIEISQAKGVLRVSNLVGLEDYLAGVLPAEMPEGYPLESLKAQAIAIRTYALRNLGKHAAVGYDVCDSPNCCQCYSGAVTSKPKCAQAAAETAGMVVTYKDEIAHVFYCADGGGATRDYSEAHPGNAIPYLRGVRDPDGVAHCAWEKSYTLEEFGAKLAQAGMKDVQSVKQVRVARAGSAGHVLTVEAATDTASVTLAGTRLRRILGEDVLKSTLFTIDQSVDGTVTFRGKGYGHGYGLCQAGAKGLAQAPYSYTYGQILAHYFPGTELTSLRGQADVVIASAPSATASPTPHSPPEQTRPAATQPSAARRVPPAGGLTFDVRLKAPDRL